MTPGWLEYGDKVASIVGALSGLLALVVAVRQRPGRGGGPRPAAPRREVWPGRVIVGLALLAIGAAAGGLLSSVTVLGLVALGCGAGAGLGGLGWWLARRRRLLPLPDAIRGLLAAQRVQADNHQYRFGSLAVPGTSRIYVQRAVSEAAEDAAGSLLTVARMLATADNAVVIGHPGTGKSTLLAHIVRRSATWWLGARACDAPRSAPYGPLVPVVVRAEALVDADVPTAVATSWSQVTGLSPESLAHQPMRRAAWLLLVDSLDEIHDPARRAAALRRLGDYIESTPANRIVVTTRPQAPGELADLVGRGVGAFRLLPFTSGDVRTFAHQWFEVRSGGLIDVEAERDRFLARLAAARLDAIVRVPLITTMAALLYESDRDRALPTSRAGMYEEFIALLRSGRDATEQAGTLAAWLTSHLDALLAAMAVASVQCGDVRLVEVAEDWTREHAPARFTAGPRSGWLGTLLGTLVASGLCSLRGSDVAFAHRSIAEYLAADTGVASLGAHELAERLADPATRGRTLFGLGRADEPVDRCVEELLEVDPVAAGRILADGVPVAAPLRGRVVEELVSRVRAEHATATESLAVLAGLSVDDEVLRRLESIVDDAEESPWVRATVAATLTESGSEIGAEVLRGFAGDPEHRGTVVGQWAALRLRPDRPALPAADSPPETSDLARIGPLGRQALRDIATDPTAGAPARLEAASMLHRLNEDVGQTVLRLLAESVDVDPDVRRVAAVLLAGSGAPAGVAVLTALTEDESLPPQLRRQAAMSLTERGIEAGTDALRRIARDRRFGSRERALAVSALADLGDSVGRQRTEARHRRRRRLLVFHRANLGLAVVVLVFLADIVEVSFLADPVVRWVVTLVLGAALSVGLDPWPGTGVDRAIEMLATLHERRLRHVVSREGLVDLSSRVRGLGHSGGIPDVAEVVRASPHARVVILGEPGAGKTTAATQLTLALLHEWRESGAVPLLLSLASWQPFAEDLDTWLVRSVTEDYPLATDHDAVLELVRTGRIIPVLDGLDELPEGARVQARDQLAATTSRYVVTCRTAEYASMPGLTGATVVVVEPLSALDVADWLASGLTVVALERWEPVLDDLRENPDGRLARLLSTPLLVTLARQVYAGGGHDPAELLDASRFPNAAALTGDLLDRYVPALYEDRDTGLAYGAAGRSLAFLAHRLDQLGQREFAWWRLELMVPARLRALLFVVAAAVPVAALVAWTGGIAQAFTGAAVALAAGFATGIGDVWGVGSKDGEGRPLNSLRAGRAATALVLAVAVLTAVLTRDLAWGAVCLGLVWVTPWARWVLAKVVFAVRGRLPIGLLGFLEDAHLRGVLRRNGPYYRFAHYLLGENLARSTVDR